MRSEMRSFLESDRDNLRNFSTTVTLVVQPRWPSSWKEKTPSIPSSYAHCPLEHGRVTRRHGDIGAQILEHVALCPERNDVDSASRGALGIDTLLSTWENFHDERLCCRGRQQPSWNPWEVVFVVLGFHRCVDVVLGMPVHLPKTRNCHHLAPRVLRVNDSPVDPPTSRRRELGTQQNCVLCENDNKKTRTKWRWHLGFEEHRVDSFEYCVHNAAARTNIRLDCDDVLPTLPRNTRTSTSDVISTMQGLLRKSKTKLRREIALRGRNLQRTPGEGVDSNDDTFQMIHKWHHALSHLTCFQTLPKSLQCPPIIYFLRVRCSVACDHRARSTVSVEVRMTSSRPVLMIFSSSSWSV